MKWPIHIFNVACLAACHRSVHARNPAGDAAGDAVAIAPSAMAAAIESDNLKCELHVSKAPAARPGGGAAMVSWEDSSPEHARGTVLVAERRRRRLVVFEWDVAAGVEVRRVDVGPSDVFDVSMMLDGDEVHLAVSSNDGPGGVSKIVHYVLDRSLHVSARHAVGLGEFPVLVAADGVVAIASFEELREGQFQVFLRTFSYPAWAPLATVESPFADGEIRALRYSGGGSLVAKFSRVGQTRLIVYDARTLKRGATWGPSDGSYDTGVVQGHTAVLGNGVLTELSDSLEILRSRPVAGFGNFMEDPDTGAIATVCGELFVCVFRADPSTCSDVTRALVPKPPEH